MEASYSLYDKAFFDNLPTILIMAVIVSLTDNILGCVNIPTVIFSKHHDGLNIFSGHCVQLFGYRWPSLSGVQDWCDGKDYR